MAEVFRGLYKETERRLFLYFSISIRLTPQYLTFHQLLPIQSIFPSSFYHFNLLSPPTLPYTNFTFIIRLHPITTHETNSLLPDKMHSLHYAAGFTGLLFSILQPTTAFPTTSDSLHPALAPSTLLPRALDGYVDCSEDQQRKLGQGFADAATLARWTFDHPIDLNYAACVFLLYLY